MKKVVILTYYFAPYGGVSVQRVLKLVKHLKEFGWEPVVITAKNPKGNSIDTALSSELDPNIKIYRLAHLDLLGSYQKFFGKKSSYAVLKEKKPTLLKKIFFALRGNLVLPDAKVLGFWLWRSKVKEICRQEKPDLIFSTSPPHSIQLLAMYISQRLNIPWVCDLRDPWRGLFINKNFYQSSLSKWCNGRLERKVLRHADEVIAVSKLIQREAKALDRKHTHLIYNGFDATQFEDSLLELTTKKFHIVFVGSYSYDMHPLALTQSLEEIGQEYDTFFQDLEIHLAGNIEQNVIQDFENLKLTPYLKLPGFISQHQAIELQKKAALLLLPLRENKKTGDMISAKVFEYLASRSEILSFGHNDYEIYEILSDCQRKPILSHTDTKSTKTQILNAYIRWQKNRTPFKYKTSFHERYNRKDQVKKISSIFDKTLKNHLKITFDDE